MYSTDFDLVVLEFCLWKCHCPCPERASEKTKPAAMSCGLLLVHSEALVSPLSLSFYFRLETSKKSEFPVKSRVEICQRVYYSLFPLTAPVKVVTFTKYKQHL